MASVASLLKVKQTPMPHQWQTVEFWLSHFDAYNLSSCGSGKTLPTVLSLKALYESGARQRILVVAPLSVLPSTWQDALEDHAPDIPLMWLDNSANRKKRAAQIAGFKGIVLINPDGIQSVWHELVFWKPGLCVVDELAGYYRNFGTNRWKALASLKFKTKMAMWACTGTPITKNLMDAYSQCLLVNPDRMPRMRNGKVMTYVAFRNMLMTSPAPHVWLPKPNAVEIVHNIMQPAIRFSRADVMGSIKTPILIRKEIALTPEQKRLMEEMTKEGRAKYGTSIIRAKEVMTLITKACQIALGEVYDSKGNSVSIPSGPRLQALLDVYEEVECTPIVVAVPFIHSMHKLADELRLQGHRVALVYGETKREQRKEAIRAFQAGELDFLLCHPKTMAHGVTLTKSSTVVWYGPLYDLELYAQLCDRIFRFGQTGQPLIIEFSSTPIEKRIYQSLRGKEALSGSYLELFGGLAA